MRGVRFQGTQHGPKGSEQKDIREGFVRRFLVKLKPLPTVR